MPARLARQPVVLALAATLALAVAWPLLAGRRTDEQRIAAAIDDVIEAIEDRDAGDVMDHVSRRYHDAHGLGHDDLYRWLVAMLFRRRAVRVQRVSPTRIELGSDGTAHARFTAAAFEGLRLSALRDAGLWKVDLEFAREPDGVWRITSHRRVRIR